MESFEQEFSDLITQHLVAGTSDIREMSIFLLCFSTAIYVRDDISEEDFVKECTQIFQQSKKLSKEQK